MRGIYSRQLKDKDLLLLWLFGDYCTYRHKKTRKIDYPRNFENPLMMGVPVSA